MRKNLRLLAYTALVAAISLGYIPNVVFAANTQVSSDKQETTSEASFVEPTGIIEDCRWTLDKNGTLTIKPAKGSTGTLKLGEGQLWPWDPRLNLNIHSDIKSFQCEGEINATGTLFQMFYGCKNLKTVNLNGLKTDNVTDMSYMFDDCAAIKSLEFPKTFDTANVTAMINMFNGCTNLTTLDLSVFNTNNVTTMNGMFWGCRNLNKVTFGDSFRGLKFTQFDHDHENDIWILQPGDTTLPEGTKKTTEELKALAPKELKGTWIKKDAPSNDCEVSGHDWGAPTYEWNEDHTACTATRVCARDSSHTETVKATVTSETKDPTCTEDGTTTYTATFAEDWAETQTVTTEVSALGHDWGAPTYEWNEDHTACTATRVCARDSSHTETAEATVIITSNEDGTETHTATFDEDWAETQTLIVKNTNTDSSSPEKPNKPNSDSNSSSSSQSTTEQDESNQAETSHANQNKRNQLPVTGDPTIPALMLGLGSSLSLLASAHIKHRKK